MLLTSLFSHIPHFQPSSQTSLQPPCLSIYLAVTAPKQASAAEHLEWVHVVGGTSLEDHAGMHQKQRGLHPGLGFLCCLWLSPYWDHSSTSHDTFEHGNVEKAIVPEAAVSLISKPLLSHGPAVQLAATEPPCKQVAKACNGLSVP